MSCFDFRAYEHNGDARLLESLDLATKMPCVSGETWMLLGEVMVDEGHPADDERDVRLPSIVKVKVQSWPAQFWRFEITRANEGEPSEPETCVMETGSGGFKEYWEIAKTWADHRLTITEGD